MMISNDLKQITRDINQEERQHIGDFINSLLKKFREKEKQIDRLCSNRDDKIALKAHNTWLQWSTTFLGNLHKLGISVREYQSEYSPVYIEVFKKWLRSDSKSCSIFRDKGPDTETGPKEKDSSDSSKTSEESDDEEQEDGRRMISSSSD